MNTWKMLPLAVRIIIILAALIVAILINNYLLTPKAPLSPQELHEY